MWLRVCLALLSTAVICDVWLSTHLRSFRNMTAEQRAAIAIANPRGLDLIATAHLVARLTVVAMAIVTAWVFILGGYI